MKDYGIRLAIIYCCVWFIDFLDATSLNVTLPVIAQFFHIDPIDAEWAIVGFLLTITLGMSISGWLGDRYGTRKIFLLSQFFYILSSIGCGLAFNMPCLILWRLIQGFSAGMAIPLGMAALTRVMPESRWAKTTSYMNMVTLFAPAIGPLFGTYAASTLGWRWVFFLKIPVSLFCFLLSYYWVKEEKRTTASSFDGASFALAGISLTGILYVFSEIGKVSINYLAILFAFSVLFGYFFVKRQSCSKSPLYPLAIFKIPHFAFGNLIQSAANTIFLGANFLIALYLQKGLGLDLVTIGWILSAVTPGMVIIQPLIGKFYNKVGPLPYIIPGLILLSLSTLAFAFTSTHTSPYFFGFLIFCIGASSAIAQSANVSSIFSSLPREYKGAGSSLYSLFKQLSASFGVAVSTMVLSLGLYLDETSTLEQSTSLSIYHYGFLVLAAIPALALLFCRAINNRIALKQINIKNGAQASKN